MDKICSKCKRKLNITQFNKNCKAKDGLCTICKDCQKQYRIDNRDKRQAYYKEHKQYYLDYDEKRKNDPQRIKQKRQNYLNNADHYVELSKLYYQNNREQCLKREKEYYQNNKQKLQQYSKQYYVRNKEKYLKYAKQYRIRNKDKIAEQDKIRNLSINRRISRFVHQGLTKANIQNEHWELYFNYTVSQLKEHLESQFTSEMNWDNYGKYGWHIDHIIPQCQLPYTKVTDKNFKICWSLANLRPLWYTDNLSRPKDGSDISEEKKLKILNQEEL